MDENKVVPGMRVKTNSTLSGTGGILVKQKYLDQRKADMPGFVLFYVAGHGGDVWWVNHGPVIAGKADPDFVAPYMFDEFEPA